MRQSRLRGVHGLRFDLTAGSGVIRCSAHASVEPPVLVCTLPRGRESRISSYLRSTAFSHQRGHSVDSLREIIDIDRRLDSPIQSMSEMTMFRQQSAQFPIADQPSRIDASSGAPRTERSARGWPPRSIVKWADRQAIILPEWRRLPLGSGGW